MTKIEVFRIEPEVGEKCYEYAESTTTEGKWPDEKHFTNIEPLYVGRFIKSENGGRGDGGWRRDYFQDNKGTEHVVNYSYEGKTCFRVVPCIPNSIPSLEELSRAVVKKNFDYSSLPDTDTYVGIIERNQYNKVKGGKSRRYRRSNKTKQSRRSNKTKQSRRSNKTKQRRSKYYK